MPKEYSIKFKTEVIRRYQNGESILALSQELRIAQSTIYHWKKNTAPSKLQIAPTHQKNLMYFRGGWKNWNMKWRLSNNPAILQMYRCRKSCQL